MNLPWFETVVLTFLVWLVSALYASVGHGGASGDIAVMSFVGVPAALMKPTALLLNLVVSTIATHRFARSGYFSWRLFWPFAVASIPAAFLGGRVTLPSQVYRPLVGVVLLVAAYRLIRLGSNSERESVKNVPVLVGTACGAVIGFLSGLAGVGGGIFLSPLLLLTGWAQTRQSAAVSAAFILVNSVAGLAGDVSAVHRLPSLVLWLVPAAVSGGVMGSYFGSAWFNPVTLRRLLAVTVGLAAVKMIIPT